MSRSLPTTSVAPEDASRRESPGWSGDAKRLARDLADRVRGEVRFDAGSRALWATDASNYRQVPIGVVLPRDAEDAVRAVEVARAHDAPVLARGGGTSLAGQCCNTAVVIDFSKYLHGVLEVDPEGRRARVEPGAILDDLRDAARPYGLTFGPDPSTHAWCTIGGMVGNNACGVRSVLAEFEGPGPRMSDNVESLEVLTYEGLRLRVGRTSEEELERIVREGGRRGEIYGRLRALRDRYADRIRERFPDIPRRVSGYNLDELLPENGFHLARALVGSESTCATVLEATVTLLPNPDARVLLVLGYPDVYRAADQVPRLREHRPMGLEGFDAELVRSMARKGMHPDEVALLPEGGGWLLVEFGGESVEAAREKALEALRELKGTGEPPTSRLLEDPEEQERIWKVRESGLGATAHIPGEPDTWEGWEDSAVPVHALGDYLRDFRELLRKYGYRASLYGHFGQACVHTRIPFDLTTAAGVEAYRAFTREAAEMVVGHGGSLSGEHGDGQSRADLLPLMFGDELVRAFREFKAIWDPAGRMNPGKVVDAHGRTENLRLGSDYRPASPETHFRLPEDEGSFAGAALRCVGVGQCRRMDAGTMCPSYMVLREEKHTTRGRARLLFEMLRGDVITDGWRSDEVREALDLCLSCKGCKGDCPVNVDIATYKAEFLSHYYERRLRPRQAYAFGLIYWWARLASRVPRLVNLATRAPGLAPAAKLLAGMAPEREFPRFATRTFRRWFEDRAGPEPDRPRPDEDGRAVLLWPDTFNNFFHPETLASAVHVLESAGHRVRIPDRTLCCGRPLYDFGMVKRAKRQLRQVLDALRPELEAGTPVIGLEPSCVSNFRDELGSLFPFDEDARRLARQTRTLGEFLAQRAAGDGADAYTPPRLGGKALLHGHCHQKAIMDLDGEIDVLTRMGVDVEVLDSGCCGMAGPFGFEKEKYEVSRQAGERVLLPAVREAAPDTLLITDGFSCREQIRQLTDRRALHLADVLRRALERSPAP